MYLRNNKVKRSDGTANEYIRLVESRWKIEARTTGSSTICGARICWSLVLTHCFEFCRRETIKDIRPEAAVIGAWN